MKNGKNFILHGVLPVIACFLCAVVTWVFVMDAVDPTVTEDLKEVKSITLENRNVAAGFEYGVQFDAIRISGKRSDVAECITEGISLKVNVSVLVSMIGGVPKNGTYTMPEEAVSSVLPDNLSNVSVEYVNMTVTLTKQEIPSGVEQS